MGRYAAARSLLERLGLSAEDVLASSVATTKDKDGLHVPSAVEKKWKDWLRRGGHPDKNGGNESALKDMQKELEDFKRDFTRWRKDTTGMSAQQDFKRWCQETDGKDETMARMKEKAEKERAIEEIKLQGDDALKAAKTALNDKRFQQAMEQGARAVQLFKNYQGAMGRTTRAGISGLIDEAERLLQTVQEATTLRDEHNELKAGLNDLFHAVCSGLAGRSPPLSAAWQAGSGLTITQKFDVVHARLRDDKVTIARLHQTIHTVEADRDLLIDKAETDAAKYFADLESAKKDLAVAEKELEEYARALNDQQEVWLLKQVKQFGKDLLEQLTGPSSKPSSKRSTPLGVQKIAMKNMMIQQLYSALDAETRQRKDQQDQLVMLQQGNASLRETLSDMKCVVTEAMVELQEWCKEIERELSMCQGRMRKDKAVLHQAQDSRQQAESELRRLEVELSDMDTQHRAEKEQFYSELEARSKELWRHVRECQEDVGKMQMEDVKRLSQDRIFKVEYRGVIRMVECKGMHHVFGEIMRGAEHSFGLADSESAGMELQYVDPDKDTITMSRDEEFQSVCRSFSTRQHVMKLKLCLAGTVEGGAEEVAQPDVCRPAEEEGKQPEADKAP